MEVANAINPFVSSWRTDPNHHFGWIVQPFLECIPGTRSSRSEFDISRHIRAALPTSGLPGKAKDGRAQEITMRRNRLLRLIFFAVALFSASVAAQAQVRITVAFGPPALPIYEQPLCPGDGYLWTPGYWDWADADYYWVPGTWIMAPEVGFLWTPPWWGWDGGLFVFNEGYWGPQIGFYGGINYGFGYFGTGFYGGRWNNGHFFYNSSVTNVHVTNVYDEHVDIQNNSHVSYNGGQGGLEARPTSAEQAASTDRHVGPVAAQTQNSNAARGNPDLRASANQGKPPIAATARAGEFHGSAVVAAREAGGEYHAPDNRAGSSTGAHSTAVHPNDLPPMSPAASNSGNAKKDQKYQQQQQKLMDKQNQERQKLQLRQDKEHAQMTKQHADPGQQQQTEQRHQQQTQELQQRHQGEMQELQSRQGSSRPK